MPPSHFGGCIAARRHESLSSLNVDTWWGDVLSMLQATDNMSHSILKETWSRLGAEV